MLCLSFVHERCYWNGAEGLVLLGPFLKSSMASMSSMSEKVAGSHQNAQNECVETVSNLIVADIVTADDVKTFTKQDDEAMKAIANYTGPDLVLDQATSRRLLRTIDRHLMPIL